METEKEQEVGKTVSEIAETVSDAKENNAGKKGIIKAAAMVKKYIWILWAVVLVFLLFVMYKNGFFVKKGQLHKKHCIMAMALSVFSVVWYLYKPKFSDKVKRILMWVVTALSPVILFLLVELHMQSGYRNWEAYKYVGNLLILYSIGLFFFVLTNRFYPTIFIPAAFWTFFVVMNLFIKHARGTSITMTDLTLIKSAMQVAGEFKFYMSSRSAIMIILTMDYFFGICKIGEHKYFSKRLTRIAAIIVTTGFVLFSADQIFNHEYLNLKKTQYLPQRSYNMFGTALTFIGSAKIMMIETPDGYSKDALAELTSKYETDEIEGFDVKKAPSIIVIMDEALSDFQDVYDLQVSQDPFEFYNSLTEDVVDGHLYVSIHGGQTANTEYEFLTGNSKAFVPGGVSPYQSYMKTYKDHISFVHNLTALGYENVYAFHAYNTLGYNREQAYENLGFDGFYSEEAVEDPVYMRDFISDRSDFETVEKIYEQSLAQSDTPCFIFNVTMQNHLPFDEYFDNMQYPIKVTDPVDKGVEYDVYTNLCHESDIAYKELIEYFQNRSEPVMVVIFGDHQPAIYPVKDKGYPMQRYVVPFKIWTNYDIPEEHYEYMSPNYLSAKMTEIMGAPLTGYQKFLLDLQKQIPAICFYGYLDNEGNSYDVFDKESPYYELIREYWMLQYNNLFDTDKTVTDFFYLDGLPERNEGYFVD
ncbi:MAG: LTA synthase family protein [Lachnospiraceae bacterium]|nr:LTA synthase family protein [Lachnospiraceae bacterium]